MTKKIVVPDGMLRAGIRASGITAGYEDLAVEHRRRAKAILEAALEWLAENPIYITDDHVKKILDACRTLPMSLDKYRMLFAELQRTLFLEEEKEVPREIEDLMWSIPLYQNDGQFYEAIPNINETILKAFERGKFAGKKEK